MTIESIDDYSIPEIRECIKDYNVENILLDYMGGADNIIKGKSKLSAHDKRNIMTIWGISEAQLIRVMGSMGI